MRENRGGASPWALAVAAGGFVAFAWASAHFARNHGNVVASGTVKAGPSSGESVEILTEREQKWRAMEARQLKLQAESRARTAENLARVQAAAAEVTSPTVEVQAVTAHHETGMLQETWDILYPALKESEGYRNYLYKCPAGRWTVGIGCNIEAAEGGAKAELNRYFKHDHLSYRPWWGTKAVADVIRDGKESEWKRLYLSDEGVQKMLGARVSKIYNNVRRRYNSRKAGNDFDQLDPRVQTAILDLAFNVGEGGVFDGYPKFLSAVEDGRLEDAKKECTVSVWVNGVYCGGLAKRNEHRQKLFTDAIKDPRVVVSTKATNSANQKEKLVVPVMVVIVQDTEGEPSHNKTPEQIRAMSVDARNAYLRQRLLARR